MSSRLPPDSSLHGEASRWSDAVERRHHDARLMQMLLRTTPLAAVVDFGLGLLAAWLVYPELGWNIHMVWPLGLMVVAFVYAIDTVRQLSLPLDALARPAVRWRQTVYIALLALMFFGVAVFLFPMVSADHRFLLGVIASGVIPVGAMALAPVRSIVWVWLGITSVGAFIGVLQTEPLVRNVTCGLLLLMNLMLLASVESISSGMVARLRAETAALRGRQSLDLLLRDFETQADDWLWERSP